MVVVEGPIVDRVLCVGIVSVGSGSGWGVVLETVISEKKLKHIRIYTQIHD